MRLANWGSWACWIAVLILGMSSWISPASRPVFAQETPGVANPTLGVVWTPPAHPDSALRSLERIHQHGATAIRLTRPPSDSVAARAEALGVDLYVDLPVSYVPAPSLAAVLRGASSVMDSVLSLARRHASITHVGLARSVDTTVPAACEVLSEWTRRVHRGVTRLQTYYVTPFAAAADRCGDAVDVPLVDLRGHENPMEHWRRWEAASASAGVGAVGTWVRPSAPPGLRVPHSAERQARYLETALTRLVDTTGGGPPAVFVARWRDRSELRLPSRRYGLHTADGTPRPADRVLRGVYTGVQRVFAFPDGAVPQGGAYGLVLLAWGLVALLGGLYARSLFLRRTVARYFSAHGFYRDSLREGRDLQPATNGVLLGVVTIALGAAGVRTARLAAAQPVTEQILAALPSEVGPLLAGGVESPVGAGLAVGGITFGVLVLWLTGLVIVARNWGRFSLAQGLVLVVWPCWPSLLALPVALAAGPTSPVSLSVLPVVLLAGAAGTLVYVTVRVLLDYRAVTGVPWPAVLGVGLLSPLVLAGGAIALLAVRYEVPFVLLWRLATQT